MELWALIEKIPASFWGVVVGAFFSLGGVALTNRATDRRQRKQLAHDREVKDRDRELSLRKDVYLAAAEAISAGFMSVSRFPNLDVPHEKITEAYLEKSPAISKVHVIAREETARAVAIFTSELAAVYMRLFAKRIPLLVQKQHLASLTEQIATFGKERDRMLNLMKQHNLEGSVDQRRWDVIERHFTFEQQRITETARQHDQLAAPFYAAQLRYTQDCIAEMAQLTRLLVPTVVAVRRELDLPIDEAAYAQLLEDGLRKQEATMREFLENVYRYTAAQPVAPGDAPQAARP